MNYTIENYTKERVDSKGRKYTTVHPYYQAIAKANTSAKLLFDRAKVMLEEDYDEEMFERRANGIKTTSFSAWKKQKEIMASLFKK